MVRDKTLSSGSSSDRQRRIGYVGGRSTGTSLSRARAVPPSIQENSGPLSVVDVRVYNELNEDVTPRPLLAQDQQARRATGAPFVTDATSITPTESSQASVTGGLISSIVAGLPFSRSIFSASQSDQNSEYLEDFYDEDGSLPFDSVVVREQTEDEIPTEAQLGQEVKVRISETETFTLLEIDGSCVAKDTTEAAEVIERNIKYAELVKSRPGNDRYVERSMNTFNEPRKHKGTQNGRVTSKDASVNASWWDLCDNMTEENEEAGGKAQEDDEVLAIGTQDFSSQTAAIAEEGGATPGGMAKQFNSQLGATSVYAGSMLTSSTSTGLSDSIFGPRDDNRTAVQHDAINIEEGCTRILKSESMSRQLQILERIINLNTYQPKQATYRGFNILPDIDQLAAQSPPTTDADSNTSGIPFQRSGTYNSDASPQENTEGAAQQSTSDSTVRVGSGKLTSEKEKAGTAIVAMQPSTVRENSRLQTGVSLRTASAIHHNFDLDLGLHIERLFSYHCPLTRGHNVSSLTWNPANSDLVAVGYGQFDFSKQKTGLVCCWSIKNPEYPERVYATPCSVMSVGFSKSQPNLLAAGLYNGGLVIYNVATSNTDHVMDNFDASNRHTGPVWKLEWIERGGTISDGQERAELLVSTGADGRVTQWKIRKGFEGSDLMKLKRIQTKQSKGKRSEALISKYSSGLCFDFCPTDSNLYLVGTEDGHIHKCSCSYNEQYLDSYLGHTGPVYSVKWSTYDRDVFISCSADWSIKIWHQDLLQPIVSLASAPKAVADIAWSPFSSTMFACVNEGGLELWDLSQDMLDPILKYSPTLAKDTKLSSLGFSKNSDCLFVGDSEGQINIYQLHGLPKPHQNQIEALQKVIQSTRQGQ